MKRIAVPFRTVSTALVTVCLASSAFAQTKNIPVISTSYDDPAERRGIYVEELAAFIDEYIPLESKKLLIFTNCYSGYFATHPLFDRPDFATMSSQVPGETAATSGFHLEASLALKPQNGRTAQHVYDAGYSGRWRAPGETAEKPMRGQDSNGKNQMALSEFSLEKVTPTGDVRSRHILFYIGREIFGKWRDPVTGEAEKDLQGNFVNISEAIDRDRIKEAFKGEDNTTVRTVGCRPGDPGWDHPGRKRDLEIAFQKVKEEFDKSADKSKEQFIMWVGDHGEFFRTKGVSFSIPSMSEGRTSLDAMNASMEFESFVRGDTTNQVAFGFSEPLDGLNLPIMRDGGGEYIPFYAPGDFMMEVVHPGGGDPLVLTEFEERYEDDGDDIIGNQPGEGVEFRFPMDEGVFLERFCGGASLDINIVNLSPYAVVVDEVFQTTGEIAMGPYGEVVFACGFETGDPAVWSSSVQ